MKVQSVNFYNIPHLHYVNNFEQSRFSILSPVLSSDMFVPAFTGINPLEPENIEGIHCARCGKVTMSDKRYNKLLSDIKNAETGSELCKILDKNKNFVKKGYEFIPENIRLKTSPNTSADSAIAFIYNDITNIYAEKLDDGIDIMKDALKTPGLSENDKTTIKDCVDRIIKAGPSYKDYSKHHKIVIEDFRKMDYKDRKLLFQKAFMPAQRVYSFRKAMSDGGMGRINNDELRELFARTVFENSVAKAVQVNKNCDAEMPANKVVVCQECKDKCSHSKYYFSKADNYPIVKKNLLTYLRDLNFANKKGQISIPYDYVFNVARYVGFKEPALILSPTDVGILKYQQQHATLPFEKLRDIPCPSCGVRMLTYDDYGKLEKTIANTNKLTELVRLIRQNKSHVAPNLFHVAREYCDFVKANPRLSDKMVKRHMFEYVTLLNHKDMKDILQKITETIETNNISGTEKSELLRLYDKISGLCDFSKPVEIIENRDLEKIVEESDIIEPLDVYRLKYFILAKAESIKTKQYLAFPSKRMQSENKIWSEGFVKRLFKLSMFSTDHMESRYHGGSDESHNLIGLCKKCNQSKQNLNFYDWYKYFVKTDVYIKGYLKKINEFSENSSVVGYDDYPAEVAENLYFLTNKEIDLRKQYPKK